MLQKQNFFLTLAGGIDTKTDPKQVIPGKLLLLENGVFTSPKEIQKRNGHDAYLKTVYNSQTFTDLDIVPSSINSGNFVSNFNNEITLNDGFNFYSYAEGLGKWVYKAKNTICNLSTESIIRDTNSQSIPDSAINPAGLQLFAWEDSGTENVNISIVDSVTSQIIVNNKEIEPSGGGDTLKPKCVYHSNRLMLFYLDSSSGMTLKYITYSAGIFSSPVTVTTTVDATDNNYDVLSFNNRVYVAYNSNAGNVKLLYIDYTLATSSTITKTGINAGNAISIHSDSSANIWVGYATSTVAGTFIMSETLVTTVLAPTTFVTLSNIYSLTGVGESGFSYFFYDVLGTPDSNNYYSNSTISFSKVQVNGTTGSQKLFLKSAALQSKAFLYEFNSTLIPHVVTVHDAYLQPTYFLCNLYNYDSGSSLPGANVVAKIATSLAGGIPTKKSSLSAINNSESGIYQTALLQKDLLYTTTSSSGTVNTFTQMGVISSYFDFTITNPSTLVLGQNLHIASGILSMYDGATVVEHNFNLYPEDVTIVVGTSGGGLTDNSSYGYQVTYEWTDNQGQLHRSSPSPIISATTGSHTNSSNATLTIPTLRITAKSDVNIVIYRTAANGTVYYRVNLPDDPLLNSTTTNSVTYVDDSSDTDILANEQLYTTGGEVPNTAAPAVNLISSYKNRIILVPSESPSSWYYSKQVIPGSPVEFSNRFVENVSTEGGPITAVKQMDSNLILFKENFPYYVSGDGPSPSGSNNDFSQALAIASDAGCVDFQSLVTMPDGIIFKSNKGIYLLNRSLAVDYIGSDVEDFNSFSVTSAQLITFTNQIRFSLTNSTILLYDYFVKQWSVFTNLNCTSSVINGNYFTFLQPNGTVLKENPNSYKDNGSFIKLRLKTSWLSLSGIQGFSRIYKALILGEYFGPHKLLVQFAYDFNPINTQQTYIDATQKLNSNIYGLDPTYGQNSPYGGQYPTYQWRVFTDKQVCEAIQITIEDIPFTGPYTTTQGIELLSTYNESMSLSAISLEVGTKKGLNKLSANRSAS